MALTPKDKHRDRLEELLNKEPLPCRTINQVVQKYIDRYDKHNDDSYIKSYADRYEDRIRGDVE